MSFAEKTEAFMERTEAQFRAHDAIIKNLEHQVEQISKRLVERLVGSLPSNSTENPSQNVNAIILRSGKELAESEKEEARVEEKPAKDSNMAPLEEKGYVAPPAYCNTLLI